MNIIGKLSTIALAVVSLFLTLPASGDDAVSMSPLRETKEKAVSLAVKGLDVTTYFDDGGPVEGKPSITVEWNNKEWRFVSEANSRQFQKNPMRYAPRFDGYCCESLSRGKLVKGDARVFRIVDDRLYLFHDHDRKKMWSKDLPKSKARTEDHYLRIFSVDF